MLTTRQCDQILQILCNLLIPVFGENMMHMRSLFSNREPIQNFGFSIIVFVIELAQILYRSGYTVLIFISGLGHWNKISSRDIFILACCIVTPIGLIINDFVICNHGWRYFPFGCTFFVILTSQRIEYLGKNPACLHSGIDRGILNAESGKGVLEVLKSIICLLVEECLKTVPQPTILQSFLNVET